MDQGSFRDRLAFAIGFAISRSRDLLRRIVRQHVPDVPGSCSPSGWSGMSSSRGLRSARRPGAQEEAAEASTHDAARASASARLNSSSLARINRFATTLIRAEALASLVGELRQRGEAARATSRPSPN